MIKPYALQWHNRTGEHTVWITFGHALARSESDAISLNVNRSHYLMPNYKGAVRAVEIAWSEFDPEMQLKPVAFTARKA